MAESYKRAYRHPKYKTSYRIKNWLEHEKSLRNRGDITAWFNRAAIDAWTPPKNGKRGGQPIYSDIASETSLTLRPIVHLPLHQTEGFLKSILKLMDLYLPCPDHTTVSRRNQTANIRRHTGNLPDGPVHFIVDSTFHQRVEIVSLIPSTMVMDKILSVMLAHFTLETTERIFYIVVGEKRCLTLITIPCFARFIQIRPLLIQSFISQVAFIPLNP